MASSATVHRPADVEALRSIVASLAPSATVALRGTGCSYGDASLNGGGVVLDLTRLNRVRAFDPKTGIVHVEAGVTVRDLWRLSVPHGWWPPVVSGTAAPRSRRTVRTPPCPCWAGRSFGTPLAGIGRISGVPQKKREIATILLRMRGRPIENAVRKVHWPDSGRILSFDGLPRSQLQPDLQWRDCQPLFGQRSGRSGGLPRRRADQRLWLRFALCNHPA